MRLWDCSIGKNTAHVFAMDRCTQFGEELSLLNLDGDNIMKAAWLPWLFTLICNDDNKTGLHVLKGADGGCTGRVGVWSSTFLAIYGYEAHFHTQVDMGILRLSTVLRPMLNSKEKHGRSNY